MLNAGPEADYEKDRSLKQVYELPYRGFNKPGRLHSCFPGQRIQRESNGSTRTGKSIYHPGRRAV